MEENNNIENSNPAESTVVESSTSSTVQKQNPSQIAGAIVLVGIMVAGAILLRGSSAPVAPAKTAGIPVPVAPSTTPTLDPISSKDRVLGSATAKVVLVEYADFQCPFCGRFYKDSETVIVDKYVNTGKVEFVYRDFAFLGPESNRSAEAARCAGDQGKFWEYHDYLFSHQNGENKGGFSDTNLKSFAPLVGLDTKSFNQCLDAGTHVQEVADSTNAGKNAGVNGTPKGFILKNGKIVATIDGAEPIANITTKLDAALK